MVVCYSRHGRCPVPSNGVPLFCLGSLCALLQCEWGAPIYMSKPLFLDGSNSLRDSVDGLGMPDRSLHDTHIGVEPTSGQTLDFAVRVGELRMTLLV